jgi:hypothetical protein
MSKQPPALTTEVAKRFYLGVPRQLRQIESAFVLGAIHSTLPLSGSFKGLDGLLHEIHGFLQRRNVKSQLCPGSGI